MKKRIWVVFSDFAEFFPFHRKSLSGYFPSLILSTLYLKVISFFYREKERTELKNKIEELEEFKHKYEAEKQHKEVSKM